MKSTIFIVALPFVMLVIYVWLDRNLKGPPDA